MPVEPHLCRASTRRANHRSMSEFLSSDAATPPVTSNGHMWADGTKVSTRPAHNPLIQRQNKLSAPGQDIDRSLAGLSGPSLSGTCDLFVDPSTTEAALHVEAISQAAKLAKRTSLVPEEGHGGVPTKGPRALMRKWCRWRRRFRASHCLVRTTEPALWVHTIGQATQHPLLALRVPKVCCCRHLVEIAYMVLRAIDVGEAIITTKAAIHVLPVGIAPVHSHKATCVPIVSGLWLNFEGAVKCLCCICRGCSRGLQGESHCATYGRLWS